MAAVERVQQPRMLEHELEDGVASDASTDIDVPISRTESQVVKQTKVQRVLQRLMERHQPVNDLKAATASLVARVPQGATAIQRDLEEAIQQQQVARNLGEDLLDDMLALDSLANLFPDDRLARKSALRDLEALTDKVDAAKSALLQQCRALEKSSSALEKEQREEKEAHSHSEHDDMRDDSSCSRAGDQNDSDADIGDSSIRPTDVQATQKQQVSEASRGATRFPSAEDWAATRLPLRLHAQTASDGYIVVGSLPGLTSNDLEIALDDNDRSLLRLSGLRLPDAHETRALQRSVQRQLGGRPARLQEYLAAGEGVLGKIEESVRLPEDVDLSAVRATCQNGQLRLVLPRRPVRQQHQGFNARRSPRRAVDPMAAFSRGFARSPRFPAW